MMERLCDTEYGNAKTPRGQSRPEIITDMIRLCIAYIQLANWTVKAPKGNQLENGLGDRI